jgi:hypothetical protein
LDKRFEWLQAAPENSIQKSIGLNCVTDFSTMTTGHALSDRQSGNQWPL